MRLYNILIISQMTKLLFVKIYQGYTNSSFIL